MTTAAWTLQMHVAYVRRDWILLTRTYYRAWRRHDIPANALCEEHQWFAGEYRKWYDTHEAEHQRLYRESVDAYVAADGPGVRRAR